VCTHVYVCTFSLSLSRTYAQKHTPTRTPNTHTHTQETEQDDYKRSRTKRRVVTKQACKPNYGKAGKFFGPVHFGFRVATETRDIASAGLSIRALLVQKYKYCVWPGLENQVSRQAAERGQDPPLTQASAVRIYSVRGHSSKEGKTQASFGEGKLQPSQRAYSVRGHASERARPKLYSERARPKLHSEEGKTQAFFGEGKLQPSAAREQELAVLGRK
jgi:hypothetical protein